MVKFKPFRVIRPPFELMDQVASLPYDVLDDQQARDAAKNELSFIHIDRAEVDLPPTIDPYDDQVYQQARKNLIKWLKNGTLQQDAQASYYAYGMTLNGKRQLGIVGAASAIDYENDRIKKHELTRAAKEADRIKHIDTTNVNSSPILLTYRDQKEIMNEVSDFCDQNKPNASFTAFFGVQHEVWQLPQRFNELADVFDTKVPAFYIADGHHRAASTVKVAQKRRAQFPNDDAEAEFNYFLAIAFPASELQIWDYNRVLNVPIPDNFLAILAKKYDVEPLIQPHKPQKQGQVSMYWSNQWFELTPLQVVKQVDPVEELDVSLLQHNILEDIFGLHDLAHEKRIAFVGGIEGLSKLQSLVDSGEYSIAFAMYPTKMNQLLAVADNHELMPAKSTWFEPKLLSGLFVHDLEKLKKD
ncbi:hypothetical protein LOOC260_119620 [Paucilactobacillus hokkaidonensis JCM 18461]|uniref:DUF1015 domain-containing protein n=2 Tax=Paucilactobacillus hokkaidonensis TaxID=1193095 RepID=A0A0A1GZN8_9LACO|nr:DUF1015 family protein [Paucilactobacillus hokkaidonensis]KRO11169.1 hypothetical protein IV59_GL000921 [Paucilactobacillus hokkaidonensis]BAP86468.1 hypothetical protein LOOC260_119620 [Paucilactobacillus hokkaidonensis JCM 18461]